MFGELPKLFDRDFAIAYFLPSATFIAASYLILIWFGLSPVRITLSADTSIKNIATFGSLSLLGGIILLTFNRGVVRLLEGYWPYDLGYRVNWLELRRFRRLVNESQKSDEEKKAYEARKEQLPRHLQNKRNKIKLMEATRFPDEERLILPTSFGNTYRAFEVYARAMYGIDAIPGWYRLLAVVPKDYRALMDSARVQVDFWVNVCLLSLLILVEYYSVGFWTNRVGVPWRSTWYTGFPWIPLVALTLSRIAYIFARSAIAQWGNWVKSAFDMYLPELRKKLGLAAAATREDDRKMWLAFSRAILSRNAALMPEVPQSSVEELCADFRKLNPQERLLFLETALRTLCGESSAPVEPDGEQPDSNAT